MTPLRLISPTLHSLGRVTAAITLAAAVAAFPAPSLANEERFPTRPITIVVPFPPGSTADLLPRALAPHMAGAMGVAVVVENQRLGAVGSIGAAHVAKSKPDGYTVLMAPTVVMAVYQWLFKSPLYDPAKDLAPIINAASTPNIVVVHPSLPIRNLEELITSAKARPGSLSFASGGNGSSHHLCMELLKKSAAIDIVHVPYKGPAPALQDVLAGRVSLMCDNFSNAIPHVRSGRLRALALTAKMRHPKADEIPTAAESGLPGLEAGVWYSFVAPTGTPKPVIDKLNAEFTKALQDPGVMERFDALGLAFSPNSPEEFGRFIAAESAKWRAVVEAAGAKVD
ncbi:MAG: Bug family tripartite tricarboxylate transporter substrate binding protein [Burkholderiales bacterium]